ncbi:tudor domain-containing protein 5-like [Centruroides sculpturatus]|uniref:tudor domain-containing protein 5-like n=1 Tax=Centruroides sculpturatus TaxID=218467 RepID=UPI000C6EF9ED|nr:tudor domain-containing protein 5-like [Centruroides sculpturatus]XP_023231111.1 tudor domain-containing protein 5-like [Centruroides sculpturatus]
MSDKNKLLLETKQIVRSILISCPSKISIGQLCKDYRDLNGRTLPYTELGYKTAEDFVKSLNDVVRMEWMPDMNEYGLGVVADASTKHIEKMVKRQKKNTKKRHVVKKKNVAPPRYQAHCKSVAPSLNANTLKPKPVTKIASKVTKSKTTKPKGSKPKEYPKDCLLDINVRFAPNFCDNIKKTLRKELSNMFPVKLKTKIVELLHHLGGSIDLRNFSYAFKEYFGSDFPVENLGFRSLTECLMYIPDIVKLECIGSYYFVKLNPNICKPTVATNNSLHKKSNSELSEPTPNTENFNLKPNFDFRINNSKTGNLDTRENCNKKINENTVSTLKVFDILRLKAANSSAFQNSDRKEIDNLESLKQNVGSSINKTKLFDNIQSSVEKVNKLYNFHKTLPNEIKKEFQQVLSSHSGILASKFLSEYFKFTGKCFKLSDYNFFDIMELVFAFPEIFKVISLHNEKNDWLLYACDEYEPKNCHKSNCLIECSQDYTDNSTFDSSLKENIINLIKYLKKISSDDFEKIYKNKFQSELPLARFGCDNIESFIFELSNSLPIELSFEGSTLFISLCSDYPCTETINPYIPELMNGIPQDSVIPGDKYTLQSLPEKLTDFISISVCDIDSPDQFWIQLKGKTTSESLKTLMENLQVTYNNKKNDKYQMPDDFVAEHNVCAVLWSFNNTWHRGIITKVLHKDQVEVFYVDYGTKCKVSKRSLRLLKKEFLSLPSQALKGRLSYVQPISGIHWSEKAKIRFSELCMDKELVALVTNTHFEDRISIFLCNITNNQNININDILIEENLALPSLDLTNSSCTAENFKTADVYEENESYQLCDANEEFDFNITKLFLTENNDIHVIVLNQKPFISNGDIASLFQKSEGLEKALLAKKALIPYIILERSDNERLFMELKRNKVRGIKEPWNSITIYPFESIINILICLQHPSQSLMNEIEKKIKEFKNNIDNTQINELKEIIYYEDKKRKDIIQKMLDNGVCEEYVEEVQRIEQRIHLITLKIKDLKKRLSL